MNSKFIKIFVALFLVAYGGLAFAAVSSQEAAQLGNKLTLVGAEKAGNADGSIPAYEGGNKKAPASFKRATGKRPDPYANEKPLFSINSKNMNQYADKLTEGTKGLMKKYPDYRIDIYKTHRSVWYPQFVLDGTVKMATKARTVNNGISLKDAKAGYPFPIPKTGAEVMWNHMLTYIGTALDVNMSAFFMDRSGRATETGRSSDNYDYPYWDTKTNLPYAYLNFIEFTAPARMSGQLMMWHEPLDRSTTDAKVWQYLPGQRRVKMAPEVAFDTPNTATSGAMTYDDTYMFNGSMERYDWKLVGKKEMYVPYNAYRACYAGSLKELKPKFYDPSALRFELHRVWVVEATLKPGKRHIYKTRRFYVDEDSWTCVANESYDAQGKLYKATHAFFSPSYDVGGGYGYSTVQYDLIGGLYIMNMWKDGGSQVKIHNKRKPMTFYSPEAMAAKGVR
ncbi:MAG: DUF1329 domain-containing protein [Smithella sp.]